MVIQDNPSRDKEGRLYCDPTLESSFRNDSNEVRRDDSNEESQHIYYIELYRNLFFYLSLQVLLTWSTGHCNCTNDFYAAAIGDDCDI